MKGLVYLYDPVTEYVRNFCLNFRGCFKCGEVHKTAKGASWPKYPSGTASQEVMEAFYKSLNIHIPSTKESNDPPSSDKPPRNVIS